MGKKGGAVCWATVRRHLRRLGYSFRRARRIPPKEPAPKQAARVAKALGKLHQVERDGKCQVWCAIELLRISSDESGFCLQPVVPYLWQKKGRGQTVGLVSQAHGKRLNVLGFLSASGRCLHSFPTQERLTAQHLVDSVDALLPKLGCLATPAVIVLDNASVHRCKQVRAKQPEWKKKGLRLLFLPPRSHTCERTART